MDAIDRIQLHYRVVDDLTAYDLMTVCRAAADICAFGVFGPCDSCGGRGHERTAPDEAGPGAIPCMECSGTSYVFAKCLRGVIDDTRTKRGPGAVLDCPHIQAHVSTIVDSLLAR